MPKASKAKVKKGRAIGKETIEIKKEALKIIGNNISTLLNTIDKIDGKVGILTGFYFLILIQVLDMLKNYYKVFLLLYLLFFVLSIYFLLKNFWLKNIKHLYPNLEKYFDDGESGEGYYEDVFSQYGKIKESLKEAIIERRENLRTSIIFLCASLIIFVIALLMPHHIHQMILF